MFIILGKLELLYEKIENGAVFQVLGFNGKILNSVNSGVSTFPMTHHSLILPLFFPSLLLLSAGLY